MPKFFFNVMNHVKTTDFEGTELISVDAAKAEAQKDIDEIKRTRFDTLMSSWSEWSIEIRDSDGALLQVLPFSRH